GTGLQLGTPALQSGVTGYRIAAAGSGYPKPPRVVFSDPGGGTGAVGYGVVYKGALTSVVITSNGQGYSPGATVGFDTTGTSGSGAAGIVQVDSGGHVTGVKLTAFGSGYASGPAVTIAAPPGSSGPRGNITAQAVSIVYGADAASWGGTPGSLRAIVPL